MQHQLQVLSCSSSCQQCHNITKLKEQIIAAQMTLQRLHEEHNKHHDRLLRRLPQEVLETIFKFCLPERSIWGVADRQEEKRTCMPLLLGWVSRSWRLLAWSLPVLWTTIAIEPSGTGTVPHESVMLGWLGRSKTRQISLRVVLDRQRYHQRPVREISNPFFDTLNATSHRWRSLSLDLPHTWFRYFTGKGPLPLDALQLVVSSKPSASSPLPLIQIAQGSAGSMQIHFSTFPPLNVKGSWASLTTATISHTDEAEVIALLKDAPLLLELELEDITSEPSSTQLSTITHPKLKALILDEAPTSLLNRLTLPRLQIFTCDGFDDSFNQQQFTALMDRSTCSLKTLRIGVTSSLLSWTIDDLRCLSALPSITSLTLSIMDLNPDFSRMISKRQTTLIEGAPPIPFLPNLRHLRIPLVLFPRKFPWKSVASWFSLDDDHISTGFHALQSVVIRLRCTSVEFRNIVDKDTARSLWCIKQSGRNITITSSKEQSDLLQSYIKSMR